MTRPSRRWQWVLAGLLGAAISFGVAALLLPASGFHNARLLRRGLRFVNERIPGHLEVAQVSLFPGGRLVAQDISVFGPDGRLIAHAASLDTHVDFWALAHRRLHLTQTHLAGGTLLLETDARGELNLTQALTPPGPRGDLRFAVDIDGADLSIDDARFGSLAAVRRAVLRGRWAREASGIMTADAELKAEGVLPRPGPLSMTAVLGLQGDTFRAAGEVAFDDARLKVQGKLDLASGTGNATFTEAKLDPRFWQQWLPDRAVPLIEGGASISFGPKALRVVELHVSAPERGAVLGGTGEFDFDARAGAAQWTAAVPGARMSGTGTYSRSQLSGDGQFEAGTLKGRVHWSGPPDSLSLQTELLSPPLSATAEALVSLPARAATVSVLEVRGLGDTWRLTRPVHVGFADGVRVARTEFSAGPQRLWVTLESGSAEFLGRGLAFHGLAVPRAHLMLGWTGTRWTLRASAGLAHGHLEARGGGSLRGKAVEGDLQGEALALADWAGFDPRIAGLTGAVSFRLRLHGPWATPEGELTATGLALASRQQPLGDVRLSATATQQGLSAHVDLSPPTGTATADVRWLVSPEQWRSLPAWRAAAFTADITGSGLPSALLLLPSPLKGTADVTAALRGTWERPQGNAQVVLRSLHFQDLDLGDLSGHLSAEPASLQVTVRSRQPGGGALDAVLGAPWGPEPWDARPFTASLDASHFDLALFGPRFTGRLDAHLQGDGTFGTPHPRGTVSVSQATAAFPGLGKWKGVAIEAALGPTGIEVRSLSASSASGVLRANGTLRPDSARGWALESHLETSRFGVFAADRLVGFLTGRADLTGEVARGGAALELAVRELELTLPPASSGATGPTALDPDIVFLSAQGARPPSARPYVVRIHMVADNNLRVLAPDADVRARADATLALGAGPAMRGTLSSSTGTVNAYGRRLTIERASLTFGRGPDFGPINRPELEARLAETVGPYRLFLDITGRPGHLRMLSSTEPPLPPEQVAQLLITGSPDALDVHARTASEVSGSRIGASALGAVLSQTLKESLGRYMPLDVLTVQPNHLEAGKRVTSRLYVGAVQSLGVTDPRVNGSEVHANYTLSDHWSLDSRYGTARAGSLDLQWSKSW